MSRSVGLDAIFLNLITFGSDNPTPRCLLYQRIWPNWNLFTMLTKILWFIITPYWERVEEQLCTRIDCSCLRSRNKLCRSVVSVMIIIYVLFPVMRNKMKWVSVGLDTVKGAGSKACWLWTRTAKRITIIFITYNECARACFGLANCYHDSESHMVKLAAAAETSRSAIRRKR
jgi:hypothetical protein